MTFTKEQLIARARFLIKRHQDSLANHPGQDGVAMDLELARMALAGMEAEPVAWKVTFKLEGRPGSNFDKIFESRPAMNDVVSLHERGGFIVSVTPLTAPQPLTTSERAELENYRSAQRRVLEGITLEQAMLESKRLSPAEAYLKACNRRATMLQGAKPVQVALDEMTACRAYDLLMEKGGVMSPVDSFVFAWNACRSAMQSGVQPVSQHCKLPDGWVMVPVEPTAGMLSAVDVRVGGESWDGYQALADERECKEIYATMLAAAPAIQGKADGTLANGGTKFPAEWVAVPIRLTAENGAKGALSGEFSETKFINCPECFDDDECGICDGSGLIKIEVPVSWTTIKAIWTKAIDHFAAAPQQEVE